MENYPNTFLMFYVNIEDLDYRKKGINGNPISRTVEGIKNIIRTEFKDDVTNYLHDIIIHLADNEVQTQEINSCLVQYDEFKIIS